METTTALLIAIPALVVLAGVLLFASARRRDTGEAIGALARETRKRDRGGGRPHQRGRRPDHGQGRRAGRGPRAAPGVRGARSPSRAKPPVAWVPPDPDVLGVTRRQFFNRGIVTFFGLGLSGFGAACLAFLWPKLGVGFGSTINIGTKQAVDAKIADGGGFAYYPEGRMWVTHYPAAALAAAKRVYSAAEVEGMEAGYTALYQKCVHLGCRVPGVQDVAVVRVPVPRLAVQPQRREEGRPGSPRPRPLPAQRRRAARSASTPARSSSVRRSARTPRGKRPKAPTAWAGVTDTCSSCSQPCWPPAR